MSPCAAAEPSRVFVALAHRVNENLPINNKPADSGDNDPWTFFGSYSDADIAAASNLLQHASITFHVTNDKRAETAATMRSASFTPHHLWVHDDHAARAQAILVPYFRSGDRHA